MQTNGNACLTCLLFNLNNLVRETLKFKSTRCYVNFSKVETLIFNVYVVLNDFDKFIEKLYERRFLTLNIEPIQLVDKYSKTIAFITNFQCLKTSIFQSSSESLYPIE